MSIETQKKQTKEFVKRWRHRGSERSDAQSFWIDLFQSLLGVKNATGYFEFEKKVPLKTEKGEITNDFIDAYVKDTHVVIEQKGSSKSLTKKYKQSDGSMLTPFQQAKKYYENIPYDQRGQFIVTSNFKEIRIYDLNNTLPEDHAQVIKLSDLVKQPNALNFLTDVEQDRIFKEKKVSIDAGDLVAKIYDELLKQYPDSSSRQMQKSINQLCVRIVFCLYAEDAGIFGAKNAFHDYLTEFKASEWRDALMRLFAVLNTKEKDRKIGDTYYWIQEHESLGKFPYVNGGMFAGCIDIPNFTDELKELILRDASDNFDWSQISPAIFGAVFESTLNADERRKNGMHYTSIENIHKVIDPLFLNDLKKEFDEIKRVDNYNDRMKALDTFHEKLGKLKFMDPACGSGNFLTETYLSLRRLENEIIKLQHPNPMLDVGQASDYIMVSIQQFYGIELNDFAVSVAKTAMWIAESQMFEQTKDIIYAQGSFLPLKTYVHIHEGDALKMDWNDVLSNYACHYVFGNPPFVGYDWMTQSQKEDMKLFFKKTGRLDFVVAWYMKAAQYADGKPIQFAFVSTNSITQGNQAPSFFPQLLKQNFCINFAYRTFTWNSEVKDKAHVHCVIIGFSFNNHKDHKLLFDESGNLKIVKNITPYLTEGNNVVAESRVKPLNKHISKLILGNMPKDGGGFILSEEQRKEFIKKNPLSQKYIHFFLGASVFLHNKKRYCLWLLNATPTELKKMPLVLERIEQVKEFREKSKASSTRKLAETPTLFAQIAQPKNGNYIVIPRHSSERRKYIPMGFFDSSVIAGDSLLIVPNATLYEFGMLESSVHMAWMRTVAGRLKSDYRYSKDIVYNDFPFPTPTDEQKQKIEETAQAILDTRAKYPDSSLADLYDLLTMPADLLKVHKSNDKAVLQAYGLPNEASESEIVAHLFKMYEELTKDEKK